MAEAVALTRVRRAVCHHYLVNAMRKASPSRSAEDSLNECTKIEEAVWTGVNQRIYSSAYVEAINTKVKEICPGALTMSWQYGSCQTLAQVTVQQASTIIQVLIEKHRLMDGLLKECQQLRVPLDMFIAKQKAQRQVNACSKTYTAALEKWYNATKKLDENASVALTEMTKARSALDTACTEFGLICDNMRTAKVAVLSDEECKTQAQRHDAVRNKMCDLYGTLKSLMIAHLELSTRFEDGVNMMLYAANLCPYVEIRIPEPVGKYFEAVQPEASLSVAVGDLTDEAAASLNAAAAAPPNKRAKISNP